MRLVLVAAVVTLSCVASTAPSKAPARALKVVHSRYKGQSAKKLALDAAYVYILDDGDDYTGIRRMPRGGGTVETVIEPSQQGKDPSAIAVDATHVYWLMTNEDETRTLLMSAPKTAAATSEKVTEVNGKPGGLALVGDDVIFSTVETEPAIHRIGKSGTNKSLIVTLPEASEPVSLVPHNGKLLVCEYKHGKVLEVSLAGEIKELMAIEYPREIAVLGDRMRLVTLGGVFDVPSGTRLARGSKNALFDEIAAAPEGTYYRHESQLRFLPWSGGKPQILQKARYSIYDIVIADEGLYYTDDHVVWFRARAN